RGRRVRPAPASTDFPARGSLDSGGRRRRSVRSSRSRPSRAAAATPHRPGTRTRGRCARASRALLRVGNEDARAGKLVHCECEQEERGDDEERGRGAAKEARMRFTSRLEVERRWIDERLLADEALEERLVLRK